MELKVSFTEAKDTFNATLKTSEIEEISVSMDSVVSNGAISAYTGTYEIIPKVEEEVVLNTRDKILKDNVTVHKVPFYEVHNDKGMTFIVGEEIV